MVEKMKYPVGYLITFTTYGTWLHGDERNSVDKKHNQYGSEFIAPNPVLKNRQHYTLKNPPVMLDKTQRETALEVIFYVCEFRGWIAHVVHVRSNHIHIVVSGTDRPEKMMRDFKSYVTRGLRRLNNRKSEIKKYWTRHGSTRYLWTRDNLEKAADYVKNGQGKMMAYGSKTIPEPRM